MSITIAAKFNDMKWGVWQNFWPSLLSVQKYALPLEKNFKICSPEIESGSASH